MSEWQEYTPWFWQKITFDDGTSERGPDPVFRYRAGRVWVYRRPTLAEAKHSADLATW